MGDAFMNLWNTPDPQSNYALQAVRAALVIQKGSLQAHTCLMDPAHHLRFRIGVATGDRMVGNVGTSELLN